MANTCSYLSMQDSLLLQVYQFMNLNTRNKRMESATRGHTTNTSLRKQSSSSKLVSTGKKKQQTMSFLWGYVSSWMNPDQQQAQVPPPPPMPDNEKAPEQTPEIKPIKEEPIKYFTLKGTNIITC